MSAEEPGDLTGEDDAVAELMRSCWETISPHAESIAQDPRHTIRPELATSDRADNILILTCMTISRQSPIMPTTSVTSETMPGGEAKNPPYQPTHRPQEVATLIVVP